MKKCGKWCKTVNVYFVEWFMAKHFWSIFFSRLMTSLRNLELTQYVGSSIFTLLKIEFDWSWPRQEVLYFEMIGLLRLEDCGGTERRKEPRAIPVKNRREILTVRESVWVNVLITTHQIKWRTMLLFQLFNIHVPRQSWCDIFQQQGTVKEQHRRVEACQWLAIFVFLTYYHRSFIHRQRGVIDSPLLLWFFFRFERWSKRRTDSGQCVCAGLWPNMIASRNKADGNAATAGHRLAARDPQLEARLELNISAVPDISRISSLLGLAAVIFGEITCNPGL